MSLRLLSIGLLSLVFIVGMVAFISQSSLSGAQTIIIPHPDELLSQYKSTPNLVSKISSRGTGMIEGTKSSMICLQNRNQNMAKCCRETCPTVCSPFDKMCKESCIATCTSRSEQIHWNI